MQLDVREVVKALQQRRDSLLAVCCVEELLQLLKTGLEHLLLQLYLEGRHRRILLDREHAAAVFELLDELCLLLIELLIVYLVVLLVRVKSVFLQLVLQLLRRDQLQSGRQVVQALLQRLDHGLYVRQQVDVYRQPQNFLVAVLGHHETVVLCGQQETNVVDVTP